MHENKVPRYAFFDFDGTLIAHDSFKILLKDGFQKQPWRLALLLLFVPLFIVTVLFHLDKCYAKSTILWSLTVGRGKKDAIHFCEAAFLRHMPTLWFNEVLPTFEKLRQENIGIVIVSASGTLWIRALLRKQYPHLRLVIGTKLGWSCGGVVVRSKNCYQEEKVKRIKEILGDNFIWHSSWSDHVADLPILRLAPLRYVVCPKPAHKIIFDKELEGNYTLLKWTHKNSTQFLH